MAYQLFQLPRPTAISNNLTLLPGAKVEFFLTGTTTPTPVYQDAELTTPHPNPVVADSAGRFPPIYLDPGVVYRATFKASDDTEIYPAVDPINDQILSQDIIGSFFRPQSAAEEVVAVDPVDKSYDWLDIRRYGGSDDGVTPNDTALARVISAYPGGRVRFPKAAVGSATTYYFATSSANQLSGILIDADDSVLLSFPDEAAFGSQPQVVRPVRCFARNLETYYTLAPLPAQTFTVQAENFKDVFLSHADAEYGVLEKINLDGAEVDYLDVDWETDAITTFVPTSAVPNQVEVDMATADGQFKVVAVPAAAGTDVSINSGGWVADSLAMGMFLFAEDRYIAVTQNHLGAITLTTKIQSSAVSHGTVKDFPGRSTHFSYCMQLSDLTIRLVTPTHAQFLYNGTIIAEVRDTGSPVLQVGFGSLLVSGTDGKVLWRYCVRTRHKSPAGGRVIRTIIVGDSISDAGQYQGTWQYHYRSALEGTVGIRVGAITSLAVGGETSAQQLARLQAVTDLADYDYCLIMVGVNDIITGVSGSDYYNNLVDMIDLCQAAGVRVCVGYPTMFYDHSVFSDPVGQNPPNYQFGSAHRAIVRLACAEEGVVLVDTLAAMGLLTAQLVTDTDLGCDPGIRDNIHPSSYMFKQLGLAFARAVLADIVGRRSRRVPTRVVPSAWLLNGWTASTPTYEVDEAGVVRLGGRLTDAGTATTTSGTIMLQLPAHLAPSQDRVFSLAATDSSPAYKDPAIITVDTTGAVVISILAASTTRIFLDGCQWQSAVA
jgi:lysophospholipase L1-like esterase